MQRTIIGIIIALGLLNRALAVTITPTTYAYINGNGPYGLGDGGNDLTDGLYGDINPGVNLAAPDPSGWVEFGGSGEMKFSFADTVTITNIVLSMARWEPAAVYLPDTININGSPYIGSPGSSPDKDRAFLNLYGEWTGSDLTIYLYHTSYMFLDEVSFSGPTAVPEPSSGALLGAGIVCLLFVQRARRSGRGLEAAERAARL